MEHAETFTQSPARKSGILSRLFAAVVKPVREHLAEVRKEFKESGFIKSVFDNTKNEYKQEKINQVVLAAFCNAETTSFEDLENIINEKLPPSGDLFHQHGKIKTSDVMAAIQNLTHEEKDGLMQARLDYQSGNNTATLEA